MSRELPSSSDCFIIGLISLISFASIFPCALSCYYHAVNRYTKRIFLALAALSLMEIPWALQLTINREYAGRYVYSVHSLGCVFYFFMFCTFCFAINDVLRSSDFGLLYVGTVQRKRVRIAMIIVNVVTLMVVMAANIVLYIADDLNEFFSKQIYKAWVLFDAIETTALGLFITAFVSKLRSKLTYKVKSGHTQSIKEISRIQNHNNKMLAVAGKLTFMLIIFMICFTLKLIRVSWWFSPMNPRYSVDTLAPQSLKNYDLWWWLVLSVLPRIVPCIVFILLLGWPSKYFFVVLIPDKTIGDRERATSTESDRPRQTSDSIDGTSDASSVNFQMSFSYSHEKATSRDCSVDSDTGQHLVSGLYGTNSESRLSIDDDLLKELNAYSDSSTTTGVVHNALRSAVNDNDVSYRSSATATSNGADVTNC